MRFDHIPTEEILKDIADTRAEIALFKEQIRGLEILARNDRMSYFKLGAKQSGVKEREEFIFKLENILKERNDIIDRNTGNRGDTAQRSGSDCSLSQYEN